MAGEPRALGTTIAGKYRVRRVVGAGSMGVVYEAEHLDIGKRVAIKLIDSSLAGMSRPHDDWIIDNLLNPASIGPYLPIFEAIAAIEHDFEFFASSRCAVSFQAATIPLRIA